VLRVRVVDAAGNASTAYVANYALDTTAPTATMSASGGTVRQGGVATITLTLSDPATLTAGDHGGHRRHHHQLHEGGSSTYTVVITPPVNSITPITVNLGGGHLPTPPATPTAPPRRWWCRSTPLGGGSGRAFDRGRRDHSHQAGIDSRTGRLRAPSACR
jgi:hypothetical protein